MRHLIGLALTGLGVFALATGALVRFPVAHALIAAPADIYQVTRLRAENATYFDAAAVKQRTGATITVTSTIRGDVPAGDGDTAVWDSTTMVEDLDNGTTVDIRLHRAAFDRRTGRLVQCCEAAVQGDTGVQQSGIGLFWPLKVTKKDYALFEVQTRRPWPVRYDGEETVQGVRAYRFVLRIPATRLADPVPDVPGRLLGLRSDDAVAVDRYYQAQVTYWIDPRTGTPVSQRQRVLSTLQAKEGPGRLVVADMDLRLTPESQRDLADKAEDGARSIRMLKTVVPLGLLLAGSAVVVVGVVLSRRPGARVPQHRRDAPESLTSGV